MLLPRPSYCHTAVRIVITRLYCQSRSSYCHNAVPIISTQFLLSSRSSYFYRAVPIVITTRASARGGICFSLALVMAGHGQQVLRLRVRPTRNSGESEKSRGRSAQDDKGTWDSTETTCGVSSYQMPDAKCRVLNANCQLPPEASR